jgi:periplasmic protein TonB
MHVVSEKTEGKDEPDSSPENRATSGQEGSKKPANGNPAGMQFADLLLENPHLNRPKRFVDVLISFAGQAAFVVLLILIPLYYTDALNPPDFEKMVLISPPPPPPPPPSHPVRVMVRPKVSLFNSGKLIAPRAIPKQVEIVKEAPQESLAFQGVTGGVPGGVAGGTLGGVLGGVLSGILPVPPAPPRRPVHTGPVRVGGRIQPPRLLRKVQPFYPPLAKQTRTQGEVVLDCVIDPKGNVTEMKLISGNPLLVQAALGAVEQWKYQPTLLNGEPVAVEMHVNVNFVLGG